jgi:hypothetical protein
MLSRKARFHLHDASVQPLSLRTFYKKLYCAPGAPPDVKSRARTMQ